MSQDTDEVACDCAVVGAGVVGLAVGRALALAGRTVLVLEREAAIGQATSGRNSLVLHGGFLFAPGSLKARYCVPGRTALYDYCVARGIPYRRTGKLDVAIADSERAAVAKLLDQGIANGVEGLELIDGAAAARLEPAISCVAALHSPMSGIVDGPALLQALRADIEATRGRVACGAPVERGAVDDAGFVLEIGGDAPVRVRSRLLVNSAGLHAPTLARAIDGIPAQTIPPARYCQGAYFALTGPSPFARIIYPVRGDDAGVGELTPRLQGPAIVGPDSLWIDRIDYRFDASRGPAFYQGVRRYWPGLPDGGLTPAFAGIRPKIVGPDDPPHDFVVQGPADHGVPGLVNLYGIESPGLTASLALAERVTALLADHG